MTTVPVDTASVVVGAPHLPAHYDHDVCKLIGPLGHQ